MYGWLVDLKNYLIEKKILKTYSLPIPIISVGNMSVGGTGKTPHVDLLLKHLLHKNKPGVVSLSYKAINQQIQKVDLNKQEAALFFGDEPCLLQKKNPEAKIFVGPQKYKTAQWAVKNYKDLNVLILDDGFQHRKLQRDLDIVLLDASADLNDYKLLPFGKLREDFKSLQRAHVVILTKAQDSTKQKLEELLKKLPQGPYIFFSKVEAHGFLFQSVSKEWIDAKNFYQKKVFYFCGLARPEGFETLLKNNYGMNIVGSQIFSDHKPYTQKDLDLIQTQFKSSGAEILVTTEKDYVKLPETFHCLVVAIKVKIDKEEKFYEIIDRTLTNFRHRSH